MKKISVAIITFNEEKNIRRCLESVRWADEILVVDSGSTDNTVNICKEFTEKITIRNWPGYSAQKEFALRLAQNDWVLSVDADEVVSTELCKSILDLKQTDVKFDGYEIPRRVFYLGRWINHGGWYPDYKLRLFNRTKGKWSRESVHEQVILNGHSGKLKGDLLHFTYNNVADHINQINHFTTIAAEEMSKNDRKANVINLFLNPFFKFFKSYILKMGFLDGKPGLFIALTGSFYVYLKYLKLWELNRRKQSAV